MQVLDWGAGVRWSDYPDLTERIAVHPLGPHEQLSSEHLPCEVLVVRSGPVIDRHTLAQLPKLRLVVRAGSGTDNIDQIALRELDIPLTLAQADGRAVAELALGLALDLMRDISVASSRLAHGHWEKSRRTGRELAAETACVVGFGRVGSATARLLSPLTADVRVHSKHASVAEIAQSGARRHGWETAFAAASLCIVCAAPVPGYVVGYQQLSQLAPGAILVNVSRFGSVDLDAADTLLAQGHLGGVALDVHDGERPGTHPIYRQARCLATPHIGAQTSRARKQIDDQVYRTIRGVLDSE